MLSNLLEKTTNSNESLQILTQISDSLSNSNPEDAVDSIRKLCDHFKREKESAVRVKVRKKNQQMERCLGKLKMDLNTFEFFIQFLGIGIIFGICC